MHFHIRINTIAEARPKCNNCVSFSEYCKEYIHWIYRILLYIVCSAYIFAHLNSS